MLIVPTGASIPETLSAISSVEGLFCAIPNCPNIAKE
jgi:hypothetical protein